MKSLLFSHTGHILVPLPFKTLTNLLPLLSPFFFFPESAPDSQRAVPGLRPHEETSAPKKIFKDRGIFFLCPMTDLWGRSRHTWRFTVRHCAQGARMRCILRLLAQRTCTASKSHTLNWGLGFIQCLQIRRWCHCQQIYNRGPPQTCM